MAQNQQKTKKKGGKKQSVRIALDSPYLLPWPRIDGERKKELLALLSEASKGKRARRAGRKHAKRRESRGRSKSNSESAIEDSKDSLDLKRINGGAERHGDTDSSKEKLNAEGDAVRAISTTPITTSSTKPVDSIAPTLLATQKSSGAAADSSWQSTAGMAVFGINAVTRALERSEQCSLGAVLVVDNVRPGLLVQHLPALASRAKVHLCALSVDSGDLGALFGLRSAAAVGLVRDASPEIVRVIDYVRSCVSLIELPWLQRMSEFADEKSQVYQEVRTKEVERKRPLPSDSSVDNVPKKKKNKISK